MHIDTDAVSLRYRNRAVNLDQQQLLITNFHGTQQEPDLTEPANCAGYGRVRHFRRSSGDGRWPANPLPLCAVISYKLEGAEDLIPLRLWRNWQTR